MVLIVITFSQAEPAGGPPAGLTALPPPSSGSAPAPLGPTRRSAVPRDSAAPTPSPPAPLPLTRALLVSNLVSIVQARGSQVRPAPRHSPSPRSSLHVSRPLQCPRLPEAPADTNFRSLPLLATETAPGWPRAATAGRKGAEASGPPRRKMATAGGGSAAELGSRGLLRLLSFCVLLAGEASQTRELHSARRTFRSASWFPPPRRPSPLEILFLFRSHDRSSPFPGPEGPLCPGPRRVSPGPPAGHRLDSHLIRMPPFPRSPATPPTIKEDRCQLSFLPKAFRRFKVKAAVFRGTGQRY